MVLIHDRILKIDIYNFEMSQITPEKSLKSNQIYSVWSAKYAFSMKADQIPKIGLLLVFFLLKSLLFWDFS